METDWKCSKDRKEELKRQCSLHQLLIGGGRKLWHIILLLYSAVLNRTCTFHSTKTGTNSL